MQNSIETHGNLCTEPRRPLVGIVTPFESILRSVKKCARLWRTRQFYRRGMLGAHFGQVSQLYMRSSSM